VARATIGTATMLDPGFALRATLEMLDVIHEAGVPAVVRLAEGNVLQQDQREAARKETDAHNAVVRSVCEQYGWPVFHLSTLMGERYTRTPDGLHGSLEARAEGARLAAEQLACVLGWSGESGSGELPLVAKA
jgi:hypothetical protein